LFNGKPFASLKLSSNAQLFSNFSGGLNLQRKASQSKLQIC